MTKDTTPLSPGQWFLAAAVALLGALILFDASAGINWAIWVALAVTVTLLAHRPRSITSSPATNILAIGAILAAGADTRTTDTPVHVGIFWLTAVLLGAFLYCVTALDGAAPNLLALAASPFYAVARVITSSLREIGGAFRTAADSPSKLLVRRIIIVAPVVIVLLILLGGADPVINSALEGIQSLFPRITFTDRAPFFILLFVVTLGACSRLPQWNFGIDLGGLRLRSWPSTTDGMVLVGSTLATLVVFLALQVMYLFVRLPSQIGNGVTYAEYARRGFGQLCVVVTIVAAVVILAERIRDAAGTRQSQTLRKMEIALVAAAFVVLLSALQRVILYEAAYGYTLARVHATAYIVFIGGFLILLAMELLRGAITTALGQRSALLALAVVLTILYWNDQAWIMNRNIDRIAATGKFDTKYALTLSADALPAFVARRNELPAGVWDEARKWVSCEPGTEAHPWYEWNSARSAALAARAAANVAEPPVCPARNR